MATPLLQDNMAIFSSCRRWSPLIDILSGRAIFLIFPCWLLWRSATMLSSAFYSPSSFHQHTSPQKLFYFLRSVVLSFQPRLKHMLWLHNQRESGCCTIISFLMHLSVTLRTGSWLFPSTSICSLWAWNFSGLVPLSEVLWAMVFWSQLLPICFIYFLSTPWPPEYLNISGLVMIASFCVFLGCYKFMLF